MANRYLHPAVETNATGAREYKGRTYAVLRAALRMGLAHRWSFVLTMLVLLGLSAFGYQYMRQGFFPTWFTTNYIWNINCPKAIAPHKWFKTSGR